MSATGKRKLDLSSYRFPMILLSGIIVGSLLGLFFSSKIAPLSILEKPTDLQMADLARWQSYVSVVKIFGDIFINLMFTIVVPLVFATISSSIASMINLKRLGKILGYLFLVFAFTGIIASIIMIIVTSITKPGYGLEIPLQQAEEMAKTSIADQIVSALTVSDFPLLMSKRNMLPLIIFSIFFGIATASLGEKTKIVGQWLEGLSCVFLKLVSYVMYYAPVGLGAYFAVLVATYGPELLSKYASAIAIYYVVCILYFFIAFYFYAYIAGGMVGVKTFFKEIVPAAITALGTQSSLATMPTNLKAAEKIGVPKDIREIVLPIGATMHMDGTCLSSIFKITFLFAFMGREFTGIGTYISAIIVSVLGGVVMSGIPGGGLIGEMLIVNLYGFPPEAFPIVATIGYLVDPPATMVNATGDTVAAMIVTRLVEGKEWMKRKI